MTRKAARSVYPLDEALEAELANAASLYGARTVQNVRDAFEHLGVRGLEDIARFCRYDFCSVPNFGSRALAALRFLLARTGQKLKDDPILPRLAMSADEMKIVRDRLLLRLSQANQSGRPMNLTGNEVFVLAAMLEPRLDTLTAIR